MKGFRKRNYSRCANIVCLNRGVHPSIVCRRCARFYWRRGHFSADCRSVENALRTTIRMPVCACCVLTSNSQRLSVLMKRKATPFFFPTSASSGWTPLGRGSDGRFGLRRFRAKLTPTPFGTHRAFTHALPPSFGLRSVPFTVPPCFFPLPLK